MIRPLAAEGSRQARRNALQARTERALRIRSGGRCEAPGCRRPGTDTAHGFGRGNRIAVPLCDQPFTCWRACRQCHDIYDGRTTPTTGVETAQFRAMHEAIGWWLVRLTLSSLAMAGVHEPGDNPLDVMRRIERTLVATGHMDGLW